MLCQEDLCAACPGTSQPIPAPIPEVPLVAPVKSKTNPPQPLPDPALMARAPSTTYSGTSQPPQALAPAFLLMWIWHGMPWDPSGCACSSCNWLAKRAWQMHALLQDLVERELFCLI